jgi:hypothetical protein
MIATSRFTLNLLKQDLEFQVEKLVQQPSQKYTYIIMRSSREGTNSLAEQQITPHDPLPAASYR